MTCCCFWTAHTKIQNKSFLLSQWMTNVLRANANCSKLQWIADQTYKILHDCMLNCIHGKLCVFTYFSHMASSHWLRPLQSFEHLSMSTGAAIVSANHLQNLNSETGTSDPSLTNQPFNSLFAAWYKQTKDKTIYNLQTANRLQHVFLETCLLCMSSFFLIFSRIPTVTTARAANLRATLGHTIPHLKTADSPKQNQN